MLPRSLLPLPQKILSKFGKLGEMKAVYESCLLKYKPSNAADQYMARWCQVNKTHFVFFAGSEAYAPL